MAAGKPAERGILYVLWGEDPKYERYLRRSIDSVRQVHPELPIHVERLTAESSLTDKARLFEYSPFRETLFLDLDTVVLGRLDFGFDKARRFGLALSICECPYARRYQGLDGELIEYNTGVMFFNRKARPVFDRWAKLAKTVDSRIHWRTGETMCEMPENDQAGFALAIEETGFNPHVLPFNWNLRPQWHTSFYGPVKIWHAYFEVPEAVRRVSLEQTLDKTMIRHVRLSQE